MPPVGLTFLDESGRATTSIYDYADRLACDDSGGFLRVHFELKRRAM